jgi:predicted metal-dependent hydrolase
MDFPFSEEIPRHWFHGSAIATHIANGLNLIFPHGERYFVRSVHHFLDRIDDQQLLAQVRGFAGQEGRHAHEHERFFEILREQGYEIDRWLTWYVRTSGRIERLLTPELRLAVTAAAEHFTAMLGEEALTLDYIEGAHPVMRDLLKWHAAEEIEHKAVAFDVLEKVAPGYLRRTAGLALATVLLVFFWGSAARMLMKQDGLTGEEIRRGLARLGESRPIARTVFAAGIRQYLRPGFHPLDNDNIELARAYLASIGRGEA